MYIERNCMKKLYKYRVDFYINLCRFMARKESFSYKNRARVASSERDIKRRERWRVFRGGRIEKGLQPFLSVVHKLFPRFPA